MEASLEEIEQKLDDVDQQFERFEANATSVTNAILPLLGKASSMLVCINAPDEIIPKAATYASPTAYAAYYRCAEEAYKLAVSERRLVYAWRQHMLDREHECIEYMLRCVIEAPGTPCTWLEYCTIELFTCSWYQ